MLSTFFATLLGLLKSRKFVVACLAALAILAHGMLNAFGVSVSFEKVEWVLYALASYAGLHTVTDAAAALGARKK